MSNPIPQTDSDPGSDSPLDAATATPATPAPAARRPLGLIVPTIVIILFWIVTEASYRFEMGMFYRFVTRFFALVLLMLFFLIWGFTRRHFTVGGRWLAFAAIVGTAFLAAGIAHPTMGVPSMIMMGLPIVLTLSVIWLWWARQGCARRELLGITACAVAVYGTMSLMRWDGLDGRQRAEVSWRWTPSPEDRFLQQNPKRAADSVEERPALVESPTDWTSFRGGQREGLVQNVQFGDWSKSPPRELWRRRVGPGWSSVIAVGDYLFTQEQRGDREAVVCYQADTGLEVWAHLTESKERFEEPLSGTGPRATPTFHENRLYTYGAKGRLECLDAATGKPKWSHALFELTDGKTPQWGSATSPTIVDDKVIVFAGGKQNNSLLAFDGASGQKLWQTEGGTTSYSSPQVMTIAGVRQIVMQDETGLYGVQIDDGKQLWKFAGPNGGTFQPMLQPHLIEQDRLLVGWDAGVLCVQVRCAGESWKAEQQWSSTRLKPSFNDFVIHRDHIFGMDDGILACTDANGQRVWKRGRYGFGQLLLLPDINELLVLGEQGEVIRVAADPQEFREIGRFKAIEGKTWNHPILAHGRLVVRNGEEMACFEVTQSE